MTSGFMDGYKMKPIGECGENGNSREYWQERRRGEEARKALEKAAGITVAELAEQGPYLYGNGGYLYGGAA